MANSVHFSFQDIESFPIPEGFISWLDKLSQTEHLSFRLHYVFMSDEELLLINQEHLEHDYYTDIITFDLSTSASIIQSDIFISSDRVLDNAKRENVSFAHEMARVMAHGVLHLIGYGDKTKAEQLKMRQLEDMAVHEILNVSRETK